MEVKFDTLFLKSVKKLPKGIKIALSKKIEILSLNPFDSRLHTKHLSTPLEGIYFFRINREYRALFRFESATEIFLLNAKHRKDIYR